jgi:uncharacterized repeat protein (TIGR01451 family)
MLNPKLKPKSPRKNKRNRRNKRIYKYRSLLVAALFSSSSLLPMFPVLAASPTPGTVIDNQATGSFTDPSDGSEKQIESNIVQVEVAEVAGITISQAALPEEAPSGVSGAGGNQGNGDINPDDIIYFTYKITNVGNDPTQFFIPDAPSNITNGTKSGDIQIVEYDPDGSSAVDLTSNNITVPNNGDTTGSLLNGIANTNDGSVPVGGSITIRVPIKASSTLSDGDKVTVVMGDTAPNDNSAATQNQVYAAGNNDVYTEDNPDNTTGETNGTPINGDATNNRQEASASQEVAVTVTTATVPPPGTCPATPIGLVNFGITTFNIEQGDGKNVGDVIRYPSVGTVNGKSVDIVATVVDLTADDGNIYPLENNGVRTTGDPPQPTGLAVTTIADSPAGVTAIAEIRYDLVESGTNTPISSSFEVELSDIDGRTDRIESMFVPLNGFDSYFTSNPTNIQLSIDGNNLLVTGGANQSSGDAEGAIRFLYQNTSSFNLIYRKLKPDGITSSQSAAFFPDFTLFAATGRCARYDFGDAPDTGSGTGTGNYETLQANSGPYHQIVDGIYLGSQLPDADNDGTPTTNADGDDNSNSDVTFDDDDGITLSGNDLQGQTLTAGSTVNLDITAAGNGRLNAWIDWNGNGDFTDAGEQIAIDADVSGGTLNVTVPAGATVGNTYARFRYSTQTGLTPTGAASDGEVEDYQVTIAADDGNLPLGSPFTCDSTFYITIGPGGGRDQQLYDVDRSGATFTFNPIGAATNTAGGYPVNFDYNALAFNPIDNYIYAYINRSDATDGLYSPGNVVKIGNDGIVHSLGIPTGGNISGSFFAATILSDGTYVIGAGGKFATLDVSTTPPTITNSQVTVSGIQFNDFAVDPRNPASVSGKEVYGINENGSQDILVILDMTTFPPTIKSQATNPTGFNHNAGSQFVDAFGTLYYRSNSTNTLYKVNTDSNSPDYGKATAITTAPSGGNHDGVSCLFATAMEKEVQNIDGSPITEPVPAGETVQYVYKIATGNPLDVNGVTFTDDLRSATGGNPVNGTYLTDPGKVTVSNGSGNITFDNSNQTLQITNLTLPGQDPATPGADTITITAEVEVPKTTTPGTYLNQSFLTDLPTIYPPSIPSDYPPSAPYEDPTPVEVTEPLATNPNVLLVKRITAINDGTTTKDGDDLSTYNQDNSNPYDDNKVDITELPENQGDPKPDTDKWIDTTSDTTSTFLIGGINGGKVEPNDELEYTIYYLSAGDSEAENVLICDRVPGNVSFVPTSFNNQTAAAGGLQGSDRGIMWLKDGQQQSLTNTQDGDAAQYFPPGVEPSTVYPKIKCDGANTNGAVVVNLGNLPNATAPGTPNTSYGYVRFRGKVK